MGTTPTFWSMLTEVASATVHNKVEELPALIVAGTPVKAAMVGFVFDC
jgi:hypothetical protein